MELCPKTISTEEFAKLLETVRKTNSKYDVKQLQSDVSVYHNAHLVIYSVTTIATKDEYLDNNEELFFSTEPIMPSEYLRMLKQMRKEKVHVCIFAITYSDDYVDIIPVKNDPILYEMLDQEKNAEVWK